MRRKEPGIKTHSKTFRMFYYYEKFLGINPLSLSRRNQLRYSWTSLLYNCALIVLYSYTFYYAFTERLKILLPGETPVTVIVELLGLCCQFLETSSTWLIFAVHQNRMKIIVKSFVTAENSSVKLGIPDNCDELFKKFAVYLIIYNILYLVSLIISNIMWNVFDNYNLFLWIRFNVSAIASFNAGFIFIWCLFFVRRKFRRLNETVESLMQNTRTSGLIRQSMCDWNILFARVNVVSQLHRELRNIIFLIADYCALLTLCSIAKSFIFVTLNLYGVYRYMKDHPREVMDFVYLIAVSHWMLHPLALLIVISNVCGSTSDEANNTGSMLHKMLNRCKHFHDIREAVIFNSLSLDLLQNQVSISTFGLLKLNHFMAYSAIASATGYMTVMLQLYD